MHNLILQEHMHNIDNKLNYTEYIKQRVNK